jgi:arylsulfatase A-like enzyme
VCVAIPVALSRLQTLLKYRSLVERRCATALTMAHTRCGGSAGSCNWQSHDGGSTVNAVLRVGIPQSIRLSAGQHRGSSLCDESLKRGRRHIPASLAPPSDPPDILIIVLDCVSANELPGGQDPVPDMTYLESARDRFVVYSNATTVAPWTVPSHATLLTGLYPWQHGLYRGGTARNLLRLPRVHDVLRQQGYITGLFSANPFLGSEYGFSQGFHAAIRGSWTGHVLRYLVPSGEPCPGEVTTETFEQDLSRVQRLQRGLRVLDRVNPHLPQIYAFVDALARAADPAYPLDREISHPWVEQLLSEWLPSVPRARPVFCVVNLIDAHEPYLGLSEGTRERRFPGPLKRKVGLSTRLSDATPQELIRLREEYRSQLKVLDRRIRRITEIFAQHRRKDNLLLIVTSDHGQELENPSRLFHGAGVEDRLIRVPLWLGLPSGEFGGREVTQPASLVDIVPTILAKLEIPAPHALPGVNLTNLIDDNRTGPVFALSTPFDDWAAARRNRREAYPQGKYTLAAYRQDAKFTISLDETGALLEERLTTFQGHDSYGDLSVENYPSTSHQLRNEINSVFHTLLHQEIAGADSHISRRLASWGYV